MTACHLRSFSWKCSTLFMAGFSMQIKVMFLTQPCNVQRLGIILMMALGGESATHFTNLWNNFPPADIDNEIRTIWHGPAAGLTDQNVGSAIFLPVTALIFILEPGWQCRQQVNLPCEHDRKSKHIHSLAIWRWVLTRQRGSASFMHPVTDGYIGETIPIEHGSSTHFLYILFDRDGFNVVSQYHRTW